jgi:hypothetical protein
MLAALLAQAANAWKVGDKSTGMTDPGVTSKCIRWANDIGFSDFPCICCLRKQGGEYCGVQLHDDYQIQQKE